MWGTAQPGRLALGCSRFPADLPGFILCPLPPPSQNCTKSHGSLLQKGEFIFNSAWGGGILMGENYRQEHFSYRNSEGAIKQRRAAWPGQTHGPLGPEHSVAGAAAPPQLHAPRDEEQQGPSSAP